MKVSHIPCSPCDNGYDDDGHDDDDDDEVKYIFEYIALLSYTFA